MGRLNKDKINSRLKKSLSFGLIFLIVSCKTTSKIENNIKEVDEMETAEEPSGPGLQLTDENREIAAVASLSGLSVLSVFMAAESLREPGLLKSTKASYNETIMEAYRSLTPVQKRTILKQNVDQLKELRKLSGKTEKIKVMVVGAPGGSGHRSAGESMKAALEKLPGGSDLFEIKYVEPFPFGTDKWNELARQGKGEELAEMAK